MTEIANKLHALREQMQRACSSCSRDPATVQLIAVSKNHPAESVQEAIDAGQRVFGENRVQEAYDKYPDLKAKYPDLEIHLIGPLQTNKAADAVALFDVIQTLDRPELAKALAKEMEKQQKSPKLYIQVNTGNEPQKAGVSPDYFPTFYASCIKMGLKIDGLMCIPPIDEDPTLHFTTLKLLALGLKIPHLSMGMSNDFAKAIAQGATEIRVGTAIFGERSWISS